MTLEKLLSRIYDLPSIPKVVQDLIASFNSKTADATAISRNVQSDPVIAAKVLRLANSVRYGAGRKVASLDSAVVLLGVDTLKTLVVASGVTGTFKAIPGLDTKDFWRNSFMVANICKLIAKNSRGVDAEVAFTCGMLHNIGIALMYLVQSAEMKKIEMNLKAGDDRTVQERVLFGYDNNEVGARLAKAWNFPEIIVHALASQGDPLTSDPFSPYAAIIKLAEYINDSIGNNVEREKIVAYMPEELAAPLHINTFNLFEQLAKACEAEDDIEELLAA